MRSYFSESFQGEDDEEKNQIDWSPERRFINGKGKDSLNHRNVDDALRVSLSYVVTKPNYVGQKENLAQKAKDATKNKHIAHLNGLIKLWNIKRSIEVENKNTPTWENISGDVELDKSINIQNIVENVDSGLRLRELLLCLRVPLIHESSEVRASTLRTIRLLVSEAEHVDLLYEINMHYLIVR